MPELKQMTGKVTDLKAGDKTTYGKVLGVNAKVKWAVVTFEGAAGAYEHRLAMGDDFTFSREVPTAEEQAAKRLQMTLATLDMKERQARQNLDHYRQKMIEDMQAGDRASHWTWMDVPQAQAIVELWDAIAHVHRVNAQGETPMARVEAVRYVLDERAKRALEYYRPLSRSTSAVANMFEDIEIGAISALRRDLEFVVGE